MNKDVRIKTEGIKYNGSKKVIIPIIIDIINKLSVKKILDGFSGTTRFGQAMKQLDFSVDSNDLSEYSKIFGYCYLINNKPTNYFLDKINYLNSIKGKHGYFTETYGGKNNNGSSIQEDGKKRIWQIKNTLKLDAIREEIDKISDCFIERSVLITSLILALDKVDSSLGHQVSYLKEWSKRSYNDLKLEVPNLLYGEQEYEILQQDVKTIIKPYDLVYLDPPYGSNNVKMPTSRVRYASYYHLWTTVCKNDKPDVAGKANRRIDLSSDKNPANISAYESTDYNHVLKEIKNLIDILNTKYIIFSYNNKAKIKIDDLIYLFKNYKLLEIKSFSYKENVMKSCTSTNNWIGDKNINKEFIFLLEK